MPISLLRVVYIFPIISRGRHTIAMNSPCCERMAADLQHGCDVHPDRSECPDAFIAIVRGKYGSRYTTAGATI